MISYFFSVIFIIILLSPHLLYLPPFPSLKSPPFSPFLHFRNWVTRIYFSSLACSHHLLYLPPSLSLRTPFPFLDQIACTLLFSLLPNPSTLSPVPFTLLTSEVIPEYVFTSVNLELGASDEREHETCLCWSGLPHSIRSLLVPSIYLQSLQRKSSIFFAVE